LQEVVGGVVVAHETARERAQVVGVLQKLVG
jgi:hypothetical protein